MTTSPKDSLAEPRTAAMGEAHTYHPNGGDGVMTEDSPEMLLRNNLNLMENILAKDNLRLAYERVYENGGSPGIDKMTVHDLKQHLYSIWPALRKQLLEGRYRPAPVKRVEIPKKGGGSRMLGIPTVLDRFIQQAVHQVLQGYIDLTFSDHSYGFRPCRSAIDAIHESKIYVNQGYKEVVDIDLEKFFDRVNHDKLMSELFKRIKDTRVLKLIRSYLDAGAICNGLFVVTEEGTPQGGPLSPLLSNIMLDLLDKELEQRGHKFVRYADDCNIYVRTKKAGERVMASVSNFIEKKLKLKVNQEKSAVGKPSQRKFLGFTIAAFGQDERARICISQESLVRVKNRIREIIAMTRGVSIEVVLQHLRNYLGGWKGYYGHIETPTILQSLDKWIRRRIRCYILHQWGKGSGAYKALRAKGLSHEEAWMVAWSSRGYWRTSRSKFVHKALGNKYLEQIGFRPLYVK